MTFRKITEGYVIQVFNNSGECISQQFFAGDMVEYETDNRDSIDMENMPLAGNEYHPFDMMQPSISYQDKETHS